MDTKEHIEIQQATAQGHPPTDEGPYYHEPWWEAYKASVRGKLGGAVIGAIIGGIIGLATGLILPLAGATFGLGALGSMVAGFAAAGMLYGTHEFSEIGKNVGSNAAVAEAQEQRDSAKFVSLEKKIDDIKAFLFGKKTVETAANSPIDHTITPDGALPYATSHSDENYKTKGNKWVFWKVAVVGLVAGLAGGALLAAGGLSGHVLHMLSGEALSQVSQYTASMTAMGLFGASFGINRDIFRRIFDKTDLWFKGLFTSTPSQQPEQSIEKSNEKQSAPPIITVVYPDRDDCPASDTYHRDKLAGKLALLNLDPAKTMRQ